MAVSIDDLTEAQIAEFKQCFEEFDIDNSGSISASELKQLMISFGHNPTDEEIKETMAEADEDGNEEIEFEEFCILLLKKRTEVQALGELREAFNALDLDQDGWVTRAELEQIPDLTPAEIDQIMAEADTDENGKIGLDEFIAWR